MESSFLSKVKERWDALAIICAIVAVGWIAHEYMTVSYASKEEVQLAGGKADLLLDARMEALIRQRDDIKRKPKKSVDDLRDLDYLEKQLDYLRKVQRGQIK